MMADSDQSGAQTPGLSIPADTQAKFGPLIELIQASESMNDEERQYWINILPVMTAEQLKSLQDILDNERTQLAAIDAKYNKELSAIGEQKMLEQIEADRKKRLDKRKKTQAQEKEDQQKQGDALLEEIQKL